MNLVPRSEFVGLDEAAYLYTGAEAPLPKCGHAAMRCYAENKGHAEGGRAAHYAVERSCKEGLARLLGATHDDIALLGSASEALNTVYGLIDWRPGDNVVLNDLEFPSDVLPALRLRRLGVEARVVRHAGWTIDPAQLAAAVDCRTRMLIVSHVSYVSGFRHDLQALSKIASQAGALFLVDATQSLGVVPVPAYTCDFLVASSYKWLLGSHGLGVLYWNRQRRPEADPVGVGWYGLRETFASDRFQSYQLKPDAARFQTGMPNFAAIYALDASVRLLLDVGIERIEAHVLSLGAQLIEQLGGLGQDVMTPREAPRRAGNIAFVDPNGGQTAVLLARDGVHVWGGDGRVRASIHLFNDATDIARLVAGVESVRRVEAACD